MIASIVPFSAIAQLDLVAVLADAEPIGIAIHESF
jgi:hypothetical protein